MRDHLPECETWQRYNYGCICHELRACTQRVIAEGDEQSQIAYSTGYAAALDAAEAAVAAMLEEYYGDGIGRETAFAAIRALKEKS